jgi:hypothetical protein
MDALRLASAIIGGCVCVWGCVFVVSTKPRETLTGILMIITGLAMIWSSLA